MNRKRLLAYISGSANQELLLRKEYLATENRILRNQIQGRLQLNNSDRIFHGRDRQATWKKSTRRSRPNGSSRNYTGLAPQAGRQEVRRLQNRSFPGRPTIDVAIEELVLKFARENRSWGYRRIVGALSNVGHEVSHQTVTNILERHGLLPAPERERKTPWRDFIRSHTEVLAAVDFFTAEVWTAAGLITYYVFGGG